MKRSVYGPDVSDVLDWLPADQTICLRWAAADPALRHTTVHGCVAAFVPWETACGRACGGAMRIRCSSFVDTSPTLGVLDTCRYMDLNVARNWTEFQTAMRKVITPGQQALFASKEEGIGLQTQGTPPLVVSGCAGDVTLVFGLC